MSVRWRGRRLLYWLAAFVALAGITLYSETALRLGIYLVTDVLVKPLTINEVHGRLAGPFRLRGIDYTDDGIHLSLEELQVDWRPSRLLALTARVTSLQASGLQFEQQPVAEAAPAPSGPITLPQIGFPLKLVIDEARIDGIALRFSGQAEPLTVSRLLLQAETELNTLRLHKLQFDSDWLTLSLNGTLRPRNAYRTDLAMEWRVPQQAHEGWQGRGTLRGTLGKLELRQRLTSPFAANLALTATELLEELAWRGTLDVPQVASSQLPFTVAPAFTLGGKIEAQGGIDAFSATAGFSGQVDTIGEIEASADVAFAGKRLELTHLQVQRQQHPARLEASGELELSDPLGFRAEADWQSLGWPMESPLVASNRGRMSLRGEGGRYDFDGEFALGGAQIPDGQWRLSGNGDEQRLAITTLHGQLLDGSITGSASLDFAPAMRWEAKLDGTGLNPAVKWPQWPGSIGFAARTNGRLREQGMELDATLASLSGELRGRKLQGQGKGTWRGDTASLEGLELALGSVRFTASGEMADRLDFTWKLDAADLADLSPLTGGTLVGGGTLSGPLQTPRIVMQLQGNRLAFTDINAAQLQADVDLDLREIAPSRIEVQVQRLQLPGFPRQTATLQLRGPLRQHRISLVSRSDRQTLNLAINAGWSASRWEGEIRQLLIDDTALGQWRLAQPAGFSLTPQSLRLAETCLGHNGASLCASGRWEAGSAGAALRSVRFPLQLLSPYLPQRLGIEGELNGQANLALAPQRAPRLAAELAVGPGRLLLLDPLSGAEELARNYESARVNLHTSPAGQLEGRLALVFDARDRIELELQTSLAGGWPAAPLAHSLEARLRASLHELQFFSALIPEVQNLQGVVDADVALAGSLGTPRLSGQVRFTEGSLDIPRMGLKLSGLQLSASGDNSRRMELAGRALSGGGELTLSGRFVPPDSGMWSLDLAMQGKEFEVARIPEARMQVSPDLTVRITGREIRLEGELDIPSARLEPPDITLAVKPSDDVVIVGEEAPRPELWRIYTSIRMTAADSIRFIGYGFDGRIGGDLLLIDEPGSVTRGRGELHVVPGGTYKAFGQELTTDRGRLIFVDSPVDNPKLDVRASRTIGNVVAGINVGGTAQKPVLSLYSEPPMDQGDILSYLTLGRPMNDAGQGEGRALASAADTAGLVGGNYLAGYIGRQFGLEEARVETGPDSASPWLVVGKYLSPRLYVRYGVGVYEEAYSIIVRYRLTEHWQVQGEGGTHSGADILYTFERP